VGHLPLEHIGDGLDPPVGMPGESRQVVGRVVGVEVIQEQEGVKIRHFVEAEDPFQVDAGPLERWTGPQQVPDGAYHGHADPSVHRSPSFL
jgi:hypothetical protein